MSKITVDSWSTGEWIDRQFSCIKDATIFLRNVKPTYFDLVYYIKKYPKKSHKYTIPAEFTRGYFMDNIMDFVKVTEIKLKL